VLVVAFPQHGGCLCGDVRYRLLEDPVTLYACHCTDCQRQTGASFALSMVVRNAALELVRGRPQEYVLSLLDGRVKQARFCARCATRLFNPSRVAGLSVLEPGTLDDTSWLRPVGHIWTRSAQPWVAIPEDALRFEEQPRGEEMLALVRAWKDRPERF
jgi:hypothetical protein